MQFNALIVDPDLESRSRLKSACHHEQQSGERSFLGVYATSQLNLALNWIQEGREIDVVFISHRFTKEETTEFINRSKETTIGEDCAYISVLKPIEQEAAKVAVEIMSGSDGFLCEPFSVNDISVIVKIAEKVKRENAINRLRAASDLILNSVIEEIDTRALELKVRGATSRYTKQIRDAFRIFKNLDEVEREAFYTVMIERFSQVPPPVEIGYTGASKRVKGQLKSKLLEDLEQGKTDETAAPNSKG